MHVELEMHRLCCRRITEGYGMNIFLIQHENFRYLHPFFTFMRHLDYFDYNLCRGPTGLLNGCEMILSGASSSIMSYFGLVVGSLQLCFCFVLVLCVS